MLGRIKSCLRPLLFYGGFPFVRIAWRRMLAMRRVFILLYHKVDYNAAPFFGAAVRPDVFERQIRFLKRHYKIVDLSALNQPEQIDRTYSTDVIVITFDDGYRNNYRYAAPILKKYDVPATIFLATDYIGSNRLLWYDELSWILYKAVNLPDSRRLMRFELSPEIIREVERFLAAVSCGRVSILRFLVTLLKAYSAQEREEVIKRLAEACRVNIWPGDEDRPMLSWEEVREMSKHGISFGSHTMSHPVLSDISVEEARREIGESKRTIEEQIQKPVTTFAYPYGKYRDYTDEVTKVLFDEGFEYACTTTVGYEQFPVATPLTLKRRGVPPHPYLFL